MGNGGSLDIAGNASAPIRIVHGGAPPERGARWGVVHAVNNLNNFGHIGLSGGVIHTGSLHLQPGGELIGYGAIVGVVAATAANNLIHVPHSKTLTMGNAGTDKGFFNTGTMVLDTSQVTLLDLDGVTLGNVVLHSGSITVPAAGATVRRQGR